MTADEALTTLYAAQWAPMVRLAWLLVRDQMVAEDIVQDALLGMHRRWDQLGDRASAVGYLRRSVVNGSRSVLRHRGVEQAHLAREGGAVTEERTSVASAEQAALGLLGQTEMIRALETLPRRQREVLVLRYFLDLSEAQIAATLDISAGSVKAHAHRGLAALRTAIVASGTETR